MVKTAAHTTNIPLPAFLLSDCTAHFMPSADLHAIAADVFGCFTGTNVVEGAKTPSNLDVSAAPHSDDL